MANTFKNKVYNGANTSANANMNVYTVPASTTTVVIGLTLSNTATSQITADIKLSAGQTVHLAKNIPIPAGSSFEFMAGNKVVLEADIDTIGLGDSEELFPPPPQEIKKKKEK